MNKLPPFLVLPDYNPTIYTLTKASFDGKYILVEHDQILFTYPSDAYDYAQKILGGEVIFNGEDLVDAGECFAGMFVESLPSNNSPKGHRAIFSYNPEGKQKSLENDYAYFLELNEKYQSNPGNWALSYQWVQHHPAFYHREVKFPEWWILDNGWETSYTYVGEDDNGEVYVLLEHGGWMESLDALGHPVSNTQSCHDIRLDVVAPTFEEAYVLFAAQVNKYFDILGNDLEEDE